MDHFGVKSGDPELFETSDLGISGSNPGSGVQIRGPGVQNDPYFDLFLTPNPSQSEVPRGHPSTS